MFVCPNAQLPVPVSVQCVDSFKLPVNANIKDIQNKAHHLTERSQVSPRERLQFVLFMFFNKTVSCFMLSSLNISQILKVACTVNASGNVLSKYWSHTD